MPLMPRRVTLALSGAAKFESIFSSPRPSPNPKLFDDHHRAATVKATTKARINTYNNLSTPANMPKSVVQVAIFSIENTFRHVNVLSGHFDHQPETWIVSVQRVPAVASRPYKNIGIAFCDALMQTGN